MPMERVGLGRVRWRGRRHDSWRSAGATNAEC